MVKVCNKKAKLANTNNMKLQNIMFLIPVLGVGIAVEKLLCSIIFSIFFLTLKNIIHIEDKEDIHIYTVKSVLIFLITILSANIIDIDFYKTLLLFYSIVSIAGINVLAPIYKSYNISPNEECRNYKINVIMASIVLLLAILASMTLEGLEKYIMYIVSPIFIIYILLIIIIVKDNIIIE